MKTCRMILLALLMMVLIGGFAIAEPAALYAVEGEELVLFEQEGVKLYLTGETRTVSNCFDLNLVVENGTDKTIDVSYTGVANGWSFGKHGAISNGADVMPHSKGKGNLWFMFDDFDIREYADLEELRLVFSVTDADAYKTLFETDTITVYFNTEAPGTEEQPADETAASEREPIIIYGNYEVLEVGSRGDAAKQLQLALIEGGFLDGAADGIYGNGTAGGVKKFQESVGLEATGTADEETQRQLFGGVDVLAALKEEVWYFNGGSDTTLNVMRFTDAAATITQIVIDGNGRHINSENEYPYTVDSEKITVTLIDGSELVIPIAAQGNRLVLDNHAYCSESEVDAGLQGYWRNRHTSNVPYTGLMTTEYNVYFGNGIMKYEHANTSPLLRKGEYYYYGPYEAPYKLSLGGFGEDVNSQFGFNIIDGKPTLLYFDHVFEPSTKKLPGENGYKF